MEQSELNQILDQHRLWIESNGVQGQRATLGGAKLTGADLRDAYLTGANLKDADLRRAELQDANLKDANLGGANLYRANLYRAYLTGAYLTGANLHGADLRGANLTGADLRDAYLTGANHGGAILTYANLTGANLLGAILTDAILPDISWIIPGCLVQLNRIRYNGFWLMKEAKYENFVQDSFGFIIQNNSEEETFDMLVEDRIMRNIPDLVKYSGLRQIASESV